MSTDQTQEEVAKALNALVDKGNRPKLTLGNDGDVYVRNRAARRKRPIVDRNFTKSTHKDKKLRSKNAKRINYRKRAAARAGKNRQENSSQIS